MEVFYNMFVKTGFDAKQRRQTINILNSKGNYVVSREEIQTQNCNIYNLDAVMIQTQKY